jgi:putative transposase
MEQFELRRGLRFRDRDDRVWSLIRLYLADRLQFEDQNGVFECIAYRQLRQRYMAGEWMVDRTSLALLHACAVPVSQPDLQTLPAQAQAQALFRYGVVKDVAAQPTITNRVLAALCRRHLDPTTGNHPSIRTVRRWLSRYRRSSDITALADRPPVRKRMVIGPIGELFEQSIDESYLLPERPPGSVVITALRRLVADFNAQPHNQIAIRMPANSTIYGWLAGLNPRETDRKRYTTDEVDTMHRTALSIVRTTYPLQRVELDHTPLDIIVVDGVTRIALGRPWLTAAIDVRTKMILGFYVTFNPPSINSLLECMRQSMLPKDNFLRGFPSIQTEWPACGIWHSAVFDNGMEEHAIHIGRVMAELNINWEFCPRRKGRYKPHIERFFRTIESGLIHRLPGTTFSNPKQRGRYNSTERAGLDLEALRKVITQWIVEEYHQKASRYNANMAPLECWRKEIHKRTLRLPVCPAEFELTLGCLARRALHHYGISFDRIRYSSYALQELYSRQLGHGQVHRKSTPIQFRHYLHAVNYIDVLDPQNNVYMRVPAVEPDYKETVDRETHRLAKERANRRYTERYNHFDLDRVQQEIRAESRRASEQTKAVRRKRKTRKPPLSGRQQRIESQRSTHSGVQIDPRFLNRKSDRDLPNFAPLAGGQDLHGTAEDGTR